MQPEPSPIAEVLRWYGLEDTPPGNGEYPVHCPFHEDRRKSASVNASLGLFCCHGCGVKGDAYSIVMHQEGVSFSEARGIIQDRLGTSGGQIPRVSDHGGLWERRVLSPAAGDNKGNRRSLPAWSGRRLATGT